MNVFWVKLLLDELQLALNSMGTNSTPHLIKPVADAVAANASLSAAIIGGPPEDKK